MEETFEPFAKRWFSGLLRLWWVAIGGVALGLLVALTGSVANYTLTTRFLLTDNTSSLAAADLKPDDFLRSVSFKTAVQGIASVEARHAVSRQVGSTLSVEVLADEPQRVINVVVRGSSSEVVEKGRDALIARLIDVRVANVDDVVQAGKKSLAERVAATTKRIDELDSQLKALPASSNAFGDSIRVERTKRGDDLVDAAAKTSALDEWLASVPKSVQELPGDGAVHSSRVLGGMLGLVGGLALGVGIVALIVLLDHRVRTRADLRCAGVDNVIGVVRARKGRSRDLAELRVVVDRLAADDDAAMVQIVAVDTSIDSERLVAELAGASSGGAAIGFAARSAMSEGVEAVTNARDVPATVLLVGAGRSRPEDVVQAARSLTLAGCHVLGVVLDGVRDRNWRAATT